MKTYVTFGSSHNHNINGVTVDYDCVAVLEADTAKAGRELAFEFFGPKFCFAYPESQWTEDQMKYYSRGYVEL